MYINMLSPCVFYLSRKRFQTHLAWLGTKCFCSAGFFSAADKTWCLGWFNTIIQAQKRTWCGAMALVSDGQSSIYQANVRIKSFYKVLVMYGPNVKWDPTSGPGVRTETAILSISVPDMYTHTLPKQINKFNFRLILVHKSQCSVAVSL